MQATSDSERSNELVSLRLRRTVLGNSTPAIAGAGCFLRSPAPPEKPVHSKLESL